MAVKSSAVLRSEAPCTAQHKQILKEVECEERARIILKGTLWRNSTFIAELRHHVSVSMQRVGRRFASDNL